MVRLIGAFQRAPMAFQEHDPDYARVAKEIAQLVEECYPGVALEHLGSTSVPGLGGRPVLDLVLPVPVKEQQTVVNKLLEVGFIESPLTHLRPMLTARAEFKSREFPVLLYLLSPDHPTLQGWLAFREYMRSHPEECEAYAEVKRRAIAEGHTEPAPYQAAKTPYLAALSARIAGAESGAGLPTYQPQPALDPVAQTARWTAAARARESARPDRLFEDPLAEALAGAEGMALLEAEPPESRDNPFLAIRTRVFDDWLLESAGSGIRQVVLLAAGMDTRAYRLSWPDGIELWELDRPELLELKETILESTVASLRLKRMPVASDLGDELWPTQLEEAGFKVGEPSVWLAEGFFQYLEKHAVERLLDQAGELAAPGSRLLADFVSEDFLKSPWMQEYLRRLEQRQTPWRFASNRPEDLLGLHGWRIEVIRQPGEEGASFGRWPWPVAPRDQAGWPRSFLLLALR